MKKIGFISLGCPKNLVDSERMLGLLAEDGLTITNDAVLRIPVLGLRTDEAKFMRQVEELLGRHGYRAA